MDPIAQGQTQPGAANAGGEGQPQGQQANGAENRIAEMTAQMARMQGQLEQAMQVNQALVARQLTASAPVEQEAPPEIDPEEARKFGFLLKQATAPLERMLAETRAQLNQTVMQQTVNGLPSAVANRAAELQRQYNLTPAAARVYALGEMKEQELRNPGSTASEQRTQFNGAPGAVPGGAPGAGLPQNGPKPLPQNFNSLPVGNQLEILRARGADDIPF